MPERISRAEAERLMATGALSAEPPRARISRAEAEKLMAAGQLSTEPPKPPDTTPTLDASTTSGAALRGFGKGASFGFSDEIGGAANALSGAGASLGIKALQTAPGRVLVRALAPQMANQPDAAVDAFTRTLADESGRVALGAPVTGDVGADTRAAYVSGRDILRRDQSQAERESPRASLLGELAGGIAVPMPGAAAGAGAKGLTKAGLRTLQGAGSGALMGAGNSEAGIQSDPSAEGEGFGGVVGDALKSAAFGAAAAPVLGGAMEKGGRVLSRALQSSAFQNALRAVGLRAGIGDKLKSLGIETETEAQQLGKDILDAGLVKFGGTPADVARRVAEQRPGYSAMVGDVLEQAEKQAAAGKGFDFGRAAADADRGVFGAATATEQRMGGKAADLISDINRQGALTPGSYQAAQRLKQAAQESVAYGGESANRLANRQQAEVARALRKNIEDQIRENVGEEAADTLTTANKRLGLFHDVEALSENAQTRGLALAPFWSPGNIATIATAMGAGAAGGGAAGGVAGGVLPLVARALYPRVPSALAVTERALSPVAEYMGPRVGRAAATAAQQDVSRDKSKLTALIEAIRGTP